MISKRLALSILLEVRSVKQHHVSLTVEGDLNPIVRPSLELLMEVVHGVHLIARRSAE